MSPSLISMIILTVLPIICTIVIAFTNYNIKTLNTGWKFVGLKNFADIITGPLKEIFLPVFGWTIVSTTIITFGGFFVGLIYALILSNKNMKESAIYKAFLVIPWALPATIVIISFTGLLNSQYGAINGILMNLHIIAEPIMWLTEPWAARTAIVLISIWLGFPYMMNVCIGALAAIPETYYEAASIDGATPVQKFFKITLPSLANTAFPLLIGSWSFNFGNFTAAYLLLGGGPVRPDSPFAGYTDVLGSAAYKMTIQFGRFDLGAALSIILFIIVGTIAFVQMKASGQFKEVD
ncbi:sugar ABC transporter permease [Clostridium sardiniense]|uniref:Maltose/maltodextrin transport system permease protein n=1 Tax=Clostridium sardiniense TaxID=29369 RepID=A0ABS7KST8_CLOSR|nr:sugar ABC transporter permease [Clostridium sardiniense]MBY0753866.1 sugar ABC transporter permease [Clostridium sardiniense]